MHTHVGRMSADCAGTRCSVLPAIPCCARTRKLTGWNWKGQDRSTGIAKARGRSRERSRLRNFGDVEAGWVGARSNARQSAFRQSALTFVLGEGKAAPGLRLDRAGAGKGRSRLPSPRFPPSPGRHLARKRPCGPSPGAGKAGCPWVATRTRANGCDCRRGQCPFAAQPAAPPCPVI